MMKKINLNLAAICLTVGIAIMTGCAAGNYSPISELSESKDKSKSYIVKPGDILNIQVWGEPKVSGEAVVRQDGRFSIPLVDEVQAEGRSLTEITNDLVSKLSEFIPSASVNISLNQSSAIVYYLTGTFAKPGEFRTDKQVTILQAIATGGGFAPFANKSNLVLIRKSGENEKRYRLSYEKIIEGLQPNPQLETGDILSVQ